MFHDAEPHTLILAIRHVTHCRYTTSLFFFTSPITPLLFDYATAVIIFTLIIFYATAASFFSHKMLYADIYMLFAFICQLRPYMPACFYIIFYMPLFLPAAYAAISPFCCRRLRRLPPLPYFATPYFRAFAAVIFADYAASMPLDSVSLMLPLMITAFTAVATTSMILLFMPPYYVVCCFRGDMMLLPCFSPLFLRAAVAYAAVLF